MERVYQYGASVNPEGGTKTVTPTTMGFIEADGSRLPLKRVREFDSSGQLIKVYLVDEMGVRFQDLPDVQDDAEFFGKLPQTKDLRILAAPNSPSE